MICKDNVGFKELENYILTLEDKKSSLIIILHKAQEIFGYIPEEVQEFIAEKIEVPVSKVSLWSQKENIQYLFVQVQLVM